MRTGGISWTAVPPEMLVRDAIVCGIVTGTGALVTTALTRRGLDTHIK
jgi:Zn-dependent alcohol dehydrogenase